MFIDLVINIKYNFINFEENVKYNYFQYQYQPRTRKYKNYNHFIKYLYHNYYQKHIQFNVKDIPDL